MTNNAARRIDVQTKTTSTQSNQQPKINVKAHVAFSTFEKMLISLVTVLAMVLSIVLLNQQVALTNNEHTLQNIQNKIVTVSNNNVDAKQTIGELTKASRLSSIAKKDNLTFHENQIRTVR